MLGSDKFCIFISQGRGVGGGGLSVSQRNYDYLTRHFETIEIVCGQKDLSLTGRISKYFFNSNFSAIVRFICLINSNKQRVSLVWVDRSNLWVFMILGCLLGFRRKVFVFSHNDEFRYASEVYVKIRERYPGILHAIISYLIIRLLSLKVIFFSYSEYTSSGLKECRKKFFPYTANSAVNGQKRTRSSNFVFLGSDFYPNRHAISWIDSNVAPYLNKDISVAGSVAIDPQSHKRLVRLGFVECIGDLYEAHGYSLVPIFKGSGTKVKAVEALRHGLRVVTTPEIASDLQYLSPEVNDRLIVFKSPSELVSIINEAEEFVSAPLPDRLFTDENYLKPSDLCH